MGRFEIIRLADRSEIKETADIHIRNLPDDFLPRLGTKILYGFYEAFIDNNPVIIFEQNNTIIGFIGLSIYPMQYKSFFFRYFASIAKAIILQPFVWGQAIWHLFHSNKKNEPPEIFVIAVKKGYHGQGVGTALVDWACDFLAKQSFTALYVKTEVGNSETNRFYTRNMFQFIKVEKRIDRGFNVYRRLIQ